MPSSLPLVKRLWRHYIRPHARDLILAVGCMILVAAATAGNAWMMQPMLDEVFLSKRHDMLTLIPLAVVALALLQGIASYGQALSLRTVGQKVIASLQRDLYRHLLHADMRLFHQSSTGSLISHFTHDIVLLRETSASVLTSLAKEWVTLLALIGVMFYQSVTLACIALIVFPLAAYPMSRLGKRMRKIARNTQEGLSDFTAHLDETFQGIRIIKAYHQEALLEQKADAVITRVFHHYLKSFRIKAAASPIMEALAGIAVAAVIYYGGRQVVAGTTTPGAFFSFVAAMIMAYKPLKSMAGLNTNLQEALSAAERVFHVLDIAPDIQDSPSATPLKASQGNIRLENIRFAYTPDRPALDGIDLTIPAGKTIALVGASGSGKSSLVNLLLRFYDPQSGQILIDNQPTHTATLASLRQQIGLVTQETILFDDTVRANLAFSRPDATQEEIIEAAQQAEAHEFIQNLPQGYDTEIGQHGVMLSGGQRQRLAIARAMLKNAPILVLDEATSALDPIAEQKIQAALKRLVQGRTALIIAHRLSTIIDADCIHVMKEGRIVESGTHAELLALGGQYAALYAETN